MSDSTLLGLLLGWQPEPRRLRLERDQDPSYEALWHTNEGHLITFAPTGAGKGVSCIIPALLTWNGPAIVVDPKGENYAVTAAHRRSIGQKVHLLDPFKVTGRDPKDALNPLDLIDITSRTAADDAAMISELLIQGRSFKADPFWDERASTLIIGFILEVLTTSTKVLQTLAEVRYGVNSDPYELGIYAESMLASKHPEMRAAAQILTSRMAERTLACITATAASHVSFIRSGPVSSSLGPSTISLADIEAGVPMTIYIVLPPDKLQSHGKLLRLWLGVALAAMARRRHAPETPTLMLVDEAAQLGPLDELRSAITLMRGYGVKVWSFWQDLSQLMQTYPLDWRSIINNCAVQQYFGASSPRAGAEIDEYLMHSGPKPLFNLKPREALLVRAGSRPEIVVRPNYLTDSFFRGMWQPNPFHTRPEAPKQITAANDSDIPKSDNIIRFPREPQT